MKIGIAFDTIEMYHESETKKIHFDFADWGAISQIKKELDSLGCNVELIGNKDNIIRLIQQNLFDYDLIFNTVEGIHTRNREGLVPSLLESYYIPYMGTDAFGLSLSLNKKLVKMIAQCLNIRTPNYCSFGITQLDKTDFSQLFQLSLPIIVKPNLEGNSSGICVCHTYAEAIDSISQRLEQYQSEILCEEFIRGTEITVPVIGNSEDAALWCVTSVDIQQDNDFWLNLDMKIYGDYKNILVNLPASLEKEFHSAVFQLFNVIGCHDFARFDFRLSPDNQIFFIEVNPLPSLFPGGSFDLLGRINGMTYAETLRLLVNTACDRLAIPRI